MPSKCRDFGDLDAPGCLGDIDERYTMRFDDIGCPPIYWCARCGPLAHEMDKALTHMLEHKPGAYEKLQELLSVADEKMKKEAH